jgi:protoporphyrinogen oxidase
MTFMSAVSGKNWAIVGGGILGMTLAHRLRQRAQAVTLFENASQLGGLASVWSLGDVVWDRHYHVTLLSDAHLRALLAELDLEKEMRWLETKTGFYTGGKLYSMSSSLEFLRFPPLDLIQKLRLALTIFYASRLRRWQKLERISATDWLTRWSGRKTVQQIWVPLLRAKLGENYRKVSAAFIWAIIARMYAARRTGLKKEMFGYVPGGYARVLERFGELLETEHVALRLGQGVKRLTPTQAGIRVELKDGREETFSRVVVTTPAPVAAELCSFLTEAERNKLTSIQYQGIVCASLLLKKPLGGFYVTNITDSWVPFTGVIEMSSLVSRDHFGGNTLVYLPRYVPANDDFFSLSDDEIQSQFTTALLRMYPHIEYGDVVSFRISRVRYVLPLSTLHYSELTPSMKTSRAGVYIVNSAQIVNGTLNVNETIRLADRAAAQLFELSPRDD